MNKSLELRLRDHKHAGYQTRRRSTGVHARIKEHFSLLVAQLKLEYGLDHEFEGVIRAHLRHLIREYQAYVVKHNFKAHYVCVDGARFEHALPLQYLTELLLSDVITVSQALDSPTAYVSKELDNSLQKEEFKQNDTPYYFLRRYARAAERAGMSAVLLTTPFEDEINPHTWTLDDHYELVDRLWREGKFKER